MAPIHTLEVNRAIYRPAGQEAEDSGQETGELAGCHFSRSHRKFAVFYRATTTDVTADRNIVRRVGEDHLCPFSTEQLLVRANVCSVSTDEAMPAYLPDISVPGHRGASR